MRSKHIEFLLDLEQYEQRSNEWFEQRKNHLTSSDAASILGINPYSKYEDVLFDKCGISKEFKGNVATLHGQKYEDSAIELYSRTIGVKNYNFGLITYDQVHKEKETYNSEYSFLAGSPDGISEFDDLSETILLEVKCPYRRKIKMGEIPKYYVPQVQLNMFICDLEVADFIEYKPPDVLNIVRINRDDEWLNENLPKLKNFWDEVKYYREVGIEKHPKYKKTVII